MEQENLLAATWTRSFENFLNDGAVEGDALL